VYRLKKTLCGLKQAPDWYNHIDSYFLNNGFNKRNNEPTLYTKRDQKSNILIVCLYVDDMIYTGIFFLNDFKATMQSEFEMTDLGLVKYFLGIEVEQSEKGFFICQQKYATDILKRFKMNKCKPTDKPIARGTKSSKQDEGKQIVYTLSKRLVGSLMNLIATQPDIMYAVRLISIFIENPKISHSKVGKRILRYIAGTTNYGIWYSNSEDDTLVGYIDSDFSGSIDHRKITSGYAFFLGTGLISWDSKKQP